MNERQKMLLAIGVVEWDGVLSHLDQMTGRGIPVPSRILHGVQAELHELSLRWKANGLGEPKDDPPAAARKYITENLGSADAILEGIKR